MRGGWSRPGIRERGVINPSPPAPVGSATVTAHKLSDLLLEALGKFSPARAIAHSGGSGGTIAFAWQTGKLGERASVQYEVLGSAYGARNGKDGVSGVSIHTSNLSLAPIEILETQYPVLFRNFELVQDSGGPGYYRGGLSYRRGYQLLHDATVNRRGDRVRIAPSGIQGGQDGRTGRCYLITAGGEREALPGSGTFKLQPGDTFVVEGAGGGGYRRPPRPPTRAGAPRRHPRLRQPRPGPPGLRRGDRPRERRRRRSRDRSAPPCLRQKRLELAPGP